MNWCDVYGGDTFPLLPEQVDYFEVPQGVYNNNHMVQFLEMLSRYEFIVRRLVHPIVNEITTSAEFHDMLEDMSSYHEHLYLCGMPYDYPLGGCNIFANGFSNSFQSSCMLNGDGNPVVSYTWWQSTDLQAFADVVYYM